METEITIPKTLQEAIQYFGNPDTALRIVASRRWPTGVRCPYCDTENVGFLKGRKMWQCRPCRKQFSVKVGTIFEDSPIGLDKWLSAMWLITNAKNGISSCELHRAIGVTQKTAWFMLHRIRLALETGSFMKMKGTVEADETYVGGAAANMHEDERKRKIKGRGASGKAIVMGLLERGDGKTPSQVRAKVVKHADRPTLHGEIHRNVEPGSEVYTDCLPAYCPMDSDYVRQTVDHAVEYVRGMIHTNGIENFWSLLKRSLTGTYVSVNAQHLFRYVNEQVFRYNARKGKDADRFADVLGRVAGKRITYKQLIGATA